MQLVFWVSLGLVLYAYLGYPLVIWIFARSFGRDVPDPRPVCLSMPATLVIAAHNEEAFISRRMMNAHLQICPAEQLDVVVVSDGSTDSTNRLVREFSARPVHLIERWPRQGKAAAINDVIPKLSSDVIVFSDANTFFADNATERLLGWFNDPQVTAVCGELELRDPVSGRNVDGLYWKYENFLKRQEQRLGVVLGANGAIYAIRRTAYVQIPPNTILDDFLIPLLARLRHGGSVLYDPAAKAVEDCPPQIRDEFRRRARIGAGGYQSLGLIWPLFSPRWGWTAFSLASHKLLRWLCPFFLIVMLVANACLLDRSLYRSLLVSQVAFYGVALIGTRVSGMHITARLVRLTTMFVSMNAALLVGFFRWVRGIRGGAWQPTARSTSTSSESSRTSNSLFSK